MLLHGQPDVVSAAKKNDAPVDCVYADGNAVGIIGLREHIHTDAVYQQLTSHLPGERVNAKKYNFDIPPRFFQEGHHKRLDGN